MDYIIKTDKLKKVFNFKQKGKSKKVEAVKGVSLSVKDGEIYGFLGPNGAGKTTTLRMLVTLLKPTSGHAQVVGYDLTKDSQEIRQNIGYVSQSGGTDLYSNAYSDLILQARLFGMDKKGSTIRANELVKKFDMESFADRKVSSYSGGQKRRLDLALGIAHKPKLLFLDEPTIGLDPQSRAHIWNEILKLRDDGMTVFFTTHYLDEADKYCDRLSIIDYGEIVAEGTVDELKSKISGDIITIGFRENIDNIYPRVEELVKAQPFTRGLTKAEKYIQIYVDGGDKVLPLIFRIFEDEKMHIETIELSKPTLDDVFLKQTGHSLRETNE